MMFRTKIKLVKVKLNVTVYKIFRKSGEVQVYSRKSCRVPYYDILQISDRTCRAYIGNEGYYNLFHTEELYMMVPEYLLEIYEDLEKV